MNVGFRKLPWLHGLLLAGILSSCSTSQTVQLKAWTEIDDVLANPTAYSGKTVTIRGWISIRHEDYGVWATSDDYANRNRRRCISLLNTTGDNELNRSLDRTYALVTGKINSDSYRDSEGRGIIRLGSCNRVAIGFEKPTSIQRISD
jgi:hypothetical protein